jgi:hypothetical protein
MDATVIWTTIYLLINGYPSKAKNQCLQGFERFANNLGVLPISDILMQENPKNPLFLSHLE